MLSQLFVATGSTLITLGVIKLFAHVLNTRKTDIFSCFLSVLATGLIMACVVRFLPPFSGMTEYAQFGITVSISALIYSIFLDATIIKSIILAATQFFIQLLSILGMAMIAAIAIS